MQYNLDTERLLIAAMISKPAVYSKVAHYTDAIFHDSHYRAWFNAIRDCYSETGECDLVAVQTRMTQEGNGWMFSERMTAVFDAPVVPTSFDAHIKVLVDCYHLRLLSAAAFDAQKATDIDTAREIVNKALLETVADTGDKGEHVADLAKDDANLLSATDTVPTGMSGIDNAIKGFGRKELVVIGGHAKHGKTTLALQLAFDMSRTMRVNFYSLEMSRKELFQKIMARKASVPMSRLSSGICSATEKAKIETARETFRCGAYNFHIVDGMTAIDEILAHAKLSVLSDDMRVMVVDYLQLCDTPRIKGQARYEQVGMISRRLKQFAMRENVIVIALSQLNGSEEDRPTISSFRESGNVGQDCNIPIFVWFDPKEMQMKVIIERSRRASAKEIKVTLYGETCTFVDQSIVNPPNWQDAREA